MASAVEIANLALGKLGDEGEINALDENSRAARAVNGCFETMRDAVLRDHPWNFAKTRVQLAASTETVVWGGWTAFPRPSDFIRFSEIEDDPDWQVEGDFILAKQPGPLNLAYIRRVTETGRFDPLFTEALACRIAMQVAARITGSASNQDRAERMYMQALASARRVDGQDNPPDAWPDDPWFIAREAG